MKTGLIHIYYGTGKGKTTAAIGLAIRCAGHDGSVLFSQFLKTTPTGELAILSQLPKITIIRSTGSSKFTSQLTPQERKQKQLQQQALWQRIQEKCHQLKPNLLILDEILIACHVQMIDEASIITFLKNKPTQTEVVLTGRTPCPHIHPYADYISEIKKQKHPFDRGIAARWGIEK